MENAPPQMPSNDTPHYTKYLNTLKGSINLAGSQIPFYQAMMPLGSIVEQLKLVESIPFDFRSKWRLEELFQREIDWERVDTDIVKGYLKQPNKLKFFSTLTVALLPLDSSKRLSPEYGDIDVKPDPLRWANEPDWVTTDVGSVQIIGSNNGYPHGALRWDPERVFAATIDGQHRLAALQRLVHDGNLDQSQLESQLSVMFLVLDERAGFSISDNQISKGDNKILTVVREIFIDLNLHSKKVSRAREILLSDQDIESKCVREILASRVGEEEIGKLPLGLVHWQGNESVKFNISSRTGPFITTVELLYAIVKDILEIKRPKDPLDADSVRKFVTSIENSLRVSRHIADNKDKYHLQPLINYVNTHHIGIEVESAFPNVPSQYVRACADSFSILWKPIIVDVFVNFAPYRDFISEVKARGGVDGDIASYLVLSPRAQASTKVGWGEEASNIIDIPLQELHSLKSKNWAFYAVFQKALFRATKIAYQNYDVIPGHKDTEFSDAWIQFLNSLDERSIFDVKSIHEGYPLWSGIGLTSAGTITWSESSVQRICSLIVLWWYFYKSDIVRPNTYLNKIASGQGSEKFPLASNFFSSLKKGISAWMNIITPDTTDSQDAIAKKVAIRFSSLMGLAKKDSKPDDGFRNDLLSSILADPVDEDNPEDQDD